MDAVSFDRLVGAAGQATPPRSTPSFAADPPPTRTSGAVIEMIRKRLDLRGGPPTTSLNNACRRLSSLSGR